jgi:hypothetical protein
MKKLIILFFQKKLTEKNLYMKPSNHDVIIRSGAKRKGGSQGFQVYTELIESPIIFDGYNNSNNKKQFLIDHVIDPLFIEQQRNFFNKKDDDNYTWIDMNDHNVKLLFAERVAQKIRDTKSRKQRKLNPDKPQRENSGHLHPSSPKKRRKNESTLSIVDVNIFPNQSDDLSMIFVDFDSCLSSDGVCEPLVGNGNPESNVEAYQDLDELLNSFYSKIGTNQDLDESLNPLFSKIENILFPVHSDDLSMASVDFDSWLSSDDVYEPQVGNGNP